MRDDLCATTDEPDQRMKDAAVPADPQQIQAEIEAARAELALTVEAIAEKVSPKKVAARSVATAKDAALTKGLVAYATLENTFAPQPVPPPIPPLPLSKRVKWDRVGSVAIGLGLFIVAVVTVRARPSKRERKLAKLQKSLEVSTLSRRAKKKVAKARKAAAESRHQAGTTALANLKAARDAAEASAKESAKKTAAASKRASKQARKAGRRVKEIAS